MVTKNDANLSIQHVMAAGYSNKLVFIYTILHAEDSNKYFDNHKNYQQLSMTNKPNNFEENQV